MVQSIKENGRKTVLTVLESLLIKMEILMKGNGFTTKLLGLEPTSAKRDVNMRVAGEGIFSMAKARRSGRMEAIMKETFTKVSSKALENTIGQTEIHIRETGRIINFMGKDCKS